MPGPAPLLVELNRAGEVQVGTAPVAVVTSLLRAFTLIAQGASKERAAFSQPFLYAVRVTDARAHAEAV